MLLLDTTVCIDLIRANNAVVATAFVSAIEQGFDIAISGISLFELQLGVLRSGNKAKEIAALKDFLTGPIDIIDFDRNASVTAANLCHRALAQGRQLSAYDGLIAGHAIALSATLVTNDTRLSASITEIDVVNWR
jgi:tRNA(fMet)-specific endonuclease VapC